MLVAVTAVKNEPDLAVFTRMVRRHVDAVVVADESDGPCYGGGIGPSLRWAWREALSLGADRVVQIDAGGSHDPAQIGSLTAVDADVVVGSRFCPGASYRGRRWRAVASRVYAFDQNIGSATRIHDWTSGFRVFTRDALEVLAYLDYTAKMHGWQAEVLHRAVDAGLTIVEAPIDYQAGATSLRWSHVREALAVR